VGADDGDLALVLALGEEPASRLLEAALARGSAELPERLAAHDVLLDESGVFMGSSPGRGCVGCVG
jgi:hypothetical protein